MHSKFERACQCVACEHPSTLPPPSMWTAAGFCHRRFMSSFVVHRRWKCSRSSLRVSDWQMFLRDILLLQRATAQWSGEPPVARLDDDRWCQRDKTGSRIKDKGMWRLKNGAEWKVLFDQMVLDWSHHPPYGRRSTRASTWLSSPTSRNSNEERQDAELGRSFLINLGGASTGCVQLFWPRNFSGAYLRESSLVHISHCSGNNNHPSCDICNTRWSQLTE